ncbi:hydroxy-delta-5-steroid dehydrogenase, 3 beta- and steroid delta-isomerase 1 [Tolypothrix sp. PCC 7601]|nr:hydroxy-delta-5-steroid dehydrogenase, 3 beta- and steroid delta-isomerase 1 [Tolypothrix sp. PCC 7601]
MSTFSPLLQDFQKLNYSISKGEDIEQIFSFPLLPSLLLAIGLVIFLFGSPSLLSQPHYRPLHQ